MRQKLPTSLAVCCCLMVCFTGSLYAQEDYAKDMPFFQRQAIQYQRWLDTLGLSPMLQVEQVRFQTDRSTGQLLTSELELLLSIRSPDPDTAAAQWLELEKAHARETGSALHHELFRAFVHSMDISPLQGNVQIIAAKKSGRRTPCFFVWVWEDVTGLHDSVMLNGCRAQPFEVNIPPVVIKQTNGKSLDASTIYKTLTPTEAFDRVMQFVYQKYPRQKYEGTDCSGRYPVVEEEDRTATELRFSVTELCREALENGKLSLWCEMARKTGWQRDCNDIRRERLEFTIVYAARAPHEGGFTLKCTLRGKFGASDYVPRSDDYYDMDPDFILFEKNYAEKFQRELTKFIREKQ